MVNFDTRVFTEQQGQVIGAEVTVYSDNGDRIGNIAITDAASITELQQRLAVIDSTYFTEERLQAILANSQETTNINATSLNGFISSDFAKVSQLNNYAPVSHNHTKNQITDLYNYQITASKYNVDIDTDVTITVKVTNQLGQPVVGVSVPVLKNNQSWKTGTTGGNGSFSLTYTADTWGLITFSANNFNTQIRVIGWKLIETKTIGECTIKAYIDGYSLKVTVSGRLTFNAGYTNQTVCTWNDERLNVGSSQFVWRSAIEDTNYQLALLNKQLIRYCKTAGTYGCYCTLYAPLSNPL